MSNTEEQYPSNFIRSIIEKDVANGKNSGQVITRFPPEPNGYLHIGHAKAICLNFGMAEEFQGATNLRFDDTNPLKESVEFINAIKRDIEWLGFNWKEARFASDYFEELYQFAEQLIKKGKAYVDSLPADELREYRGTLTQPGKDSPFRSRMVDENLDLFRRMRAGEFADGEHILRLKIDMSSPNINMRDRRSIASGILSITRRVMNGVSTPCTITPIACRIPSRVLRIHCVTSASRIIAHSTIGCWMNWP